MSANSFDIIKEGSLGNILFTGKGAAMIDSLVVHIMRSYTMAIAPPIDVEIDCAIEEFKPTVVVVCVMDETSEMMRAYSPLSSKPEYLNIPVFIVGKEEECDIFKKNVFSNRIEIFKRPFDMDRFQERLKRVMSEFVPPKPVEESVPKADDADEKTIKNEEDDLMVEESKVFAVEKSLMDKIKRLTTMSGKKTVLVVDDDVRMLNIIKLYLQDIYDVVVVPSGTLALKYLAKRHADVVLLDYMMPDMDGPAVLKEIREKSSNPAIPVVFLTGVSDKEMVLRGIELRPNGYLLKPVSRETLLEKVTEVILDL